MVGGFLGLCELRERQKQEYIQRTWPLHGKWSALNTEKYLVGGKADITPGIFLKVLRKKSKCLAGV